MCKYCDEVVNEINKKYPHADWNLDEACAMWRELSENIPDNHIKFDEGSDECYGCTCPACGKFICGWCV